MEHAYYYYLLSIQGVSEIGALILTGNRTRQKEQISIPYISKAKRLLLEKNLCLTYIHRHQLLIFFCHAFRGHPL
jgi:hypothetical protein